MGTALFASSLSDQWRVHVKIARSANAWQVSRLLSHAGQGPEKRAEYGIKDNLIRFSCGLEGVEDIWRDLVQALEAVG